MSEDTPSPVRFEGGQLPASALSASFRAAARPGMRRSPRVRSLPGHSRGVRVRCLGKGRPAMAVATGFQGRTVDVQEPRTGVRRIELPDTAADAVFADAKAFLSSSEARQMSESELERELHRRGQELIRKAPARTSRPTQPGRDCRSGRGRQAVSSAREPCDSHTKTTSGTMQVARPGLRAAPRPASARRRAEPAAGALLVRDVPREHCDRLAGTAAYALEATVVLDIIHVGRSGDAGVRCSSPAHRTAWSACRPRLAVLKPPRAAGALDAY